MIALNAQCTELEPTQSCMNLLEQLEQNNPVQMNFTPGFPAADFEECGGCIWGYSENAEQLDQAMQRYIDHVLQQEAHWNMDFYHQIMPCSRQFNFINSIIRPNPW